ncbi:MAG: extracellular solute-binding protein [Gemmatimonadaceae bacterium]|nr:extracellular solute-binding protein [Acetobacteraceae bacterium]
MHDITRRGLGLGAGALAATGLVGTNRSHAAIAAANVPPLNLPVEKGASLRVLRPAKFVDPDEVIFRENTKKFADLHGIQVRIDFSGWEDLRPQTAVTANTGAGPDVVVGWTDDPHLYADKLLDLTDVADYLGKKYGGWYPLAEKYGKKFNSNQWLAIPFGASGGLAMYRESWVKEVGYDTFPAKTDAFLDMCQKLQKSGHPAGFALGHAVGDANAYCHWVVWSHGGRMTDEAGKVTINSKETIEALKYARALYQTYIPGTQSWLDTGNNKALLAGEISVTQNGVSLYFSAKNSKDEKIAALAADMNHAVMPIGPAGVVTNGALAINAMAFKHTKFPNAAKAYLAYMMEAEQYDKWLTGSFGYWGQPLKAYEASDVWNGDPKIKLYKETMDKSRWYAWPGAITEQSGAVMADYVMVDMVAAASVGSVTPEDAAKEAERRAKRYYRS